MASTLELRAEGPAEAEAGGKLSIDLEAIVENWRGLSRRVTPAACAAVLKADAYGCGIEPVAAALFAAGCRWFFVADCAEARKVRAVAHNAAIYVLNGMPPGTLPAYAQANLHPVIGSLAELAEWRAFRSATSWPGEAALHVDTGMNRLGLSPQEAIAVAADPGNLHGIALLMSHLACADTPSHPLNARQLAAFRELRAYYPGLRGSLANSSGIFLSRDAHHDLVRAGAALYGVNPTPAEANPMLPVVRLEGRIIQTRAVAAAESVGYGSAWTAPRPSRIAMVAIGYADGLLRAAGAGDGRRGAEAIIAGQRCPVVGRISMDLTAVDVTALPADAARRGEFARFLDEQIGVDELAGRAGTIGYEVLTSLGRRYRRVWRAAKQPTPI